MTAGKNLGVPPAGTLTEPRRGERGCFSEFSAAPPSWFLALFKALWLRTRHSLKHHHNGEPMTAISGVRVPTFGVR